MKFADDLLALLIHNWFTCFKKNVYTQLQPGFKTLTFNWISKLLIEQFLTYFLHKSLFLHKIQHKKSGSLGTYKITKNPPYIHHTSISTKDQFNSNYWNFLNTDSRVNRFSHLFKKHVNTWINLFHIIFLNLLVYQNCV